MYKFYEIFKIFQNCQSFEELEEVCAAFVFLIDENYINDVDVFDYVVKQSETRFRQIENF